mmetsp:Transcript_15702/g.28199  ORF Transcript_15702/g.28199 Transcript_15702/m.28199 type:complete len:414 (+) Transcript_15702:161-1402(+)|eukprot:CAMPEP_0197523284 /NCGR_PEP_ID=MMETSP1318-20131121/8255_1 /TAXON_ID=552666 /ORGANISM="Partenskyella glossopodia, Strain RCC365" /LENGTH=413 /DNA_ID=CAMNT_0043075929 /DNA_START=154 /DNA_END=1395 /DNA_ORIENTATION=-
MDQLDSLSVHTLRKELSERGLLTKGRKEELIERLRDARAKESSSGSDGSFELTTTRSSTLHEIRWEIDWKIIEQIKQPQDGEENGEMLESAPCKIMYHDWGCYVEKYKEDGFLSFYVYGHDSAKASYSLYLKVNKTQEWKLDQDAGYYDGGWSRGWGWRCWKKLSQLKSNHVINGKIYVQVKLNIYNDIEHTSRKLPITPPPELKKRFERMLVEGIHSDITLVCDGKEFSAHKAILAATSDVFAAMFNHRMKESLDGTVEIKELDSKVLDMLLKYIYTEKLPSTFDEISLLLAADKFQINRLAVICMQALGQKLTAENVVNVMSAAHRLSHIPEARALKSLCMKYVAENAEEITAQDYFASFTRNNVNLNRELILFMAPRNPRDSPTSGGGSSSSSGGGSHSKKRRLTEMYES